MHTILKCVTNTTLLLGHRDYRLRLEVNYPLKNVIDCKTSTDQNVAGNNIDLLTFLLD